MIIYKKRDFKNKLWVQGYAQSFLRYYDEIEKQYPREQWDQERLFFREWLSLAERQTFPEIEARALLSKMKMEKDRFGSNFENGISQISQWIDANCI